MTLWLLAYLGLGAVTGFFAGLLGVGGGAILVPLLTIFFGAQAFPAGHIVHMALGTSMATICFTSVSSLRTHHAHGAVLWPVVKTIAPGIVVGTLAGSQFAAVMPSRALGIFFVIFMSYVVVQMLANFRPKPSRALPGTWGTVAVGLGIGSISALAAIGGGALSVPFMTWCNVNVRHAIGTSAAIGFPIAVSGAAGYLYAGWGSAGLPSGSFGFIYLPALAGCLVSSVLTAPVGARLAHTLPIPLLRKIFAVMLCTLLAKMLHTLFA